jgi:hypothetical protein
MLTRDGTLYRNHIHGPEGYIIYDEEKLIQTHTHRKYQVTDWPTQTVLLKWSLNMRLGYRRVNTHQSRRCVYWDESLHLSVILSKYAYIQYFINHGVASFKVFSRNSYTCSEFYLVSLSMSVKDPYILENS